MPVTPAIAPGTTATANSSGALVTSIDIPRPASWARYDVVTVALTLNIPSGETITPPFGFRGVQMVSTGPEGVKIALFSSQGINYNAAVNAWQPVDLASLLTFTWSTPSAAAAIAIRMVNQDTDITSNFDSYYGTPTSAIPATWETPANTMYASWGGGYELVFFGGQGNGAISTPTGMTDPVGSTIIGTSPSGGTSNVFLGLKLAPGPTTDGTYVGGHSATATGVVGNKGGFIAALARQAPPLPATFKWRARVVDVDGVAPTSQSFTIALRELDLGQPAYVSYSVTGTNWTPLTQITADMVHRLDMGFRRHITVHYHRLFGSIGCFLVVNPTSASTLTRVEVEITDDSTNATFTDQARLWGQEFKLFGYVLDSGSNVPRRLVPENLTSNWRSNTVYQRRILTRVNTLLAGDYPPMLTKFTIADVFEQGDKDYDGLVEGYTILRRLGVNTNVVYGTNTTLGEARKRQAKDDATIPYFGTGQYNPPGYMPSYAITPAPPYPATPAGISSHINTIADSAVAAGYDLTKMRHWGMADEPNFYTQWLLDMMNNGMTYSTTINGVVYALAAPTTTPQWSAGQTGMRDTATWNASLAEFRDYLAARGLTPADVGHGSWSTVYPTGKSKLTGTLTQRTLAYWSLWWLTIDMHNNFARETTALESHFSNVRVAINSNNYSSRWLSNPPPGYVSTDDNSTSNFDWFMIGKLHSAGTTYSEMWLHDHQLDVNSQFASFLHGAAKRGTNMWSGTYMIMQVSGEIQTGIVRKQMQHIAWGGKTFYRYRLGPTLSDANDGYSETLMHSDHVVTDQADTIKVLGRAEYILGDAKPVAAQVAILHPRSSQPYDTLISNVPVYDTTQADMGAIVTTDYMAEAYDIALALIHANVAFEWISEDELNATALAQFQVLYLTEPCVPAEFHSAITTWVNAGGTLVTVPSAGSRDRYNTPNTTLYHLGGLAFPTRSRKELQWLYGTTGGGSVIINGAGGTYTWRAGSTSVIPATSIEDYRSVPTTVPGGATITATFDDNGAPAIIKLPVGTGWRYHMAFFLATSYYLDGASQMTGEIAYKPPTIWNTRARSWITEPVTGIAGIVQPVEVGVDIVEAHVLEPPISPNGASVVLVNHNPTSETIPLLRVRPSHTVAAVKKHRAATSNVAFTQTGDGITIASLPITDVEVLSLEFSTVPDVTAPTVTARSVNNATLTIAYDETLDAASVPATSAFAVTVAGSSRGVSSVNISGSSVSLILSSAVTPGQAVTVAYIVPGSNMIQDLAGNDAASYGAQAVTNNTAGDVTPPAVTARAIDGTTLTITYNETLDTASIPATSAFIPKVNGTARGISNVSVLASSVILTLTSAVLQTDTVTLSYTVPGVNPVQDAAGNNAPSYVDQSVTNNTSGAGGTSDWITSLTPGSIRFDSIAWAGQRFMVGASPLTVTALARWVVAGNTQNHVVKLVTTAGTDVAGGSAVIVTSGATAGTWKFTTLSAPVTLTANTEYSLVSAESSGDSWYDFNNTFVTTSVASPTGTTFNISASGGSYILAGSPGNAYVPTNFRYQSGTAPGDTTPPIVTSLSVNGSTLTIKYNEPLDSAFVPLTSQYTCKVAGVTRTVTNVGVSNDTVTLTLASPVTGGQSVTLSYTP